MTPVAWRHTEVVRGCARGVAMGVCRAVIGRRVRVARGCTPPATGMHALAVLTATPALSLSHIQAPRRDSAAET